MRAKIVTILAILLLAVMSISFGIAFAADRSGEDAGDALEVVSVGWAGNAEDAKHTGFSGIDAADMGFQIWFSEPIRSGNTTHLLRVGLSEEITSAVLDYVMINDKTMGELFEEIKAANGEAADVDDILQIHVQGESNNLQFSIRKDNTQVGDGKYASLDACFFYLDATSKRPTEQNTVTVKAGFTAMDKTVAEDIRFVFLPDTGNGTWVVDNASAPAVNITSIYADDSKDNEVSITINFDGPINRETVNHMARENEGTVIAVNGGGATGQAKLDNIKSNGLRNSVWNKIVINDVTILQWMEEAKVDPPAGGDTAGAVDVHVKGGADGNYMEIKIKNGFHSSIELTDGLRVGILEGFRSDLCVFQEDVVYTYTGGVWTREGVVRDQLAVVNVADGSNDDTYIIEVTFAQDINQESVLHMARENEGTVVAVNGGGAAGQAKLDNIKANGLRDSVWNKIRVGNMTVWEMMEAAKAGDAGDTTASVDLHLREPNFLTIEIKKNSVAMPDLAQDVQLTFLSGFQSDLVTAASDICYTQIDGVWYAEGEEPKEQVEVMLTSIVHKDSSDIEFTLTFDHPISSAAAIHMARADENTVSALNGAGVLATLKSGGLRDSVWNKVWIGDSTIKQLMDQALEIKDEVGVTGGGEDAIDVHIEGATVNSMRIVVKNIYQFIDFTKDFTITIGQGFHSDVAKVSADIVFTYSAAFNFWLAPGEQPPSFDAVELIGLDAPIMKSAAENRNVEFVLRFDEEIANRQHAYISMPADFVGTFVGSSGDYSATELESFTKYGVFDSMAKCILLNGKSVYDMMMDSGYEYTQRPNVAVVHAAQGSTGNNTLRLVIGGEYTEDGQIKPRPYQITDLNQNFVITVKAGLRTPLGQEVKEDISFIFDPVSQKWYEGDTVDAIPVYVTVTFMDGDTVLNTMSCQKGETVVAGIARKDGYTFAGWYTDAACTVAWDADAAVNEDITVYAKFTANQDGQDPGSDSGETEKGGCNSALFGGMAALAIGMITVAGALMKRRER